MNSAGYVDNAAGMLSWSSIDCNQHEFAIMYYNSDIASGSCYQASWDSYLGITFDEWHYVGVAYFNGIHRFYLV
jgi:hypothetical protein